MCRRLLAVLGAENVIVNMLCNIYHGNCTIISVNAIVMKYLTREIFLLYCSLIYFYRICNHIYINI